MKPTKEQIHKASEYVQRHARYYADAPTKPYVVRYPEHSATIFFSADTWELVEQLARHLAATDKQKG